jgi:adenosylmethionine-8-amino-7-oxononanoate aminotransferase
MKVGEHKTKIRNMKKRGEKRRQMMLKGRRGYHGQKGGGE